MQSNKMILKGTKGFTLIELLVVITIISVITGLGINVTNKFADRRSVDNITSRISTQLNLSKLLSAKHGVEHKTVLHFNNQILTMTIQRGNSSQRSFNWEDISSHSIEVLADYTITPSNKSFHFNPNNTLGQTGSRLCIKPTNPATSKIKKCGMIIAHSFGRIRTIQGNWDATISHSCKCKAIRDKQN